MAKFIRRFASGVALLAMLAGTAAAQTVTGTIQGRVTDTSGAVLPGVTIVIKNMETGGARTVVTNEAGLYSAPSFRSAATRSPRPWRVLVR